MLESGDKDHVRSIDVHTKLDHDVIDLVFLLVGLLSRIGWVGFGLKTLTANTQSTLPGLIVYMYW